MTNDSNLRSINYKTSSRWSFINWDIPIYKKIQIVEKYDLPLLWYHHITDLPSRWSSARAIPGSQQAPTTPTASKCQRVVLEASSSAAAQVAAVLTDGCCCCWQREREGLLLLRPKPPSSSSCFAACLRFRCAASSSTENLLLLHPLLLNFFSKKIRIFPDSVPWLVEDSVSTPSDALSIALRHTQHKYLIRMSAQLIRGVLAKFVIVLLESVGKSILSWSKLKQFTSLT